jgi:nucleotide-binding universal stress UspA family protein
MMTVINTIFLPVDFSPCSLRAVGPAIGLAKISGGRIILLNISEVRSSTAPPFYFSVPPPIEYEKDLRDLTLSHLRELAKSIIDEGVSSVEVYCLPGTPYSEIVRSAVEHSADLIIMGTHGASGFNEFFIGTNASRVVGKSACPVLTIQESGELRSFETIVIPFKQKIEEETFDYARYLAKAYKATIHLLPILDTDEPDPDPLPSEVLRTRIEKEGIHCVSEEISGSFQARQVLGYASEQKAGLILIEGHHGRETFTDYFTGPFAQQIVNHSKIPVLTMRVNDIHFYESQGKSAPGSSNYAAI